MSDDHITPDWIRAVFPAKERFDPCPYPRPSWDGLKVDWKDRTFANIPYGRKSKVNAGTEAWADKAIAEYERGISPIAVLFRHDHSTNFYAKMHLAGAHPLFINERVQFLHPDGTPNGDSPNFISTLMILA
jgi:hypothetical protein